MSAEGCLLGSLRTYQLSDGECMEGMRVPRTTAVHMRQNVVIVQHVVFYSPSPHQTTVLNITVCARVPTFGLLEDMGEKSEVRSLVSRESAVPSKERKVKARAAANSLKQL